MKISAVALCAVLGSASAFAPASSGRSVATGVFSSTLEAPSTEAKPAADEAAEEKSSAVVDGAVVMPTEGVQSSMEVAMPIEEETKTVNKNRIQP